MQQEKRVTGGKEETGNSDTLPLRFIFRFHCIILMIVSLVLAASSVCILSPLWCVMKRRIIHSCRCSLSTSCG